MWTSGFSLSGDKWLIDTRHDSSCSRQRLRMTRRLLCTEIARIAVDDDAFTARYQGRPRGLPLLLASVVP